jgi:hypothetical protein
MLDLFEELRNVLAILDAGGIPYALCGGLAMAVHGFPRATVDIDIVVLANDLARVEEAVRTLGFTIPAMPMSFSGGAVEIRRRTKVHPSGQILALDMLLVTPALEFAWKTRQSLVWAFGAISVVSREGLIALKSLRGSGRDQDDIKQLRGENE